MSVRVRLPLRPRFFFVTYPFLFPFHCGPPPAVLPAPCHISFFRKFFLLLSFVTRKRFPSCRSMDFFWLPITWLSMARPQTSAELPSVCLPFLHGFRPVEFKTLFCCRGRTLKTFFQGFFNFFGFGGVPFEVPNGLYASWAPSHLFPVRPFPFFSQVFPRLNCAVATVLFLLSFGLPFFPFSPAHAFFVLITFFYFFENLPPFCFSFGSNSYRPCGLHVGLLDTNFGIFNPEFTNPSPYFFSLFFCASLVFCRVRERPDSGIGSLAG